MQINWPTLVEGTVTGVAASVVIAAYLSLRGSIRSSWLRWSIRRGLRHVSFGTGIRGLTIGLSNRTPKPVTVRGIALAGAKTRYRLSPTGEVEPIDLYPKRKLTKQEVAELKAGKAIPVSQELAMRNSWNDAPQPSGFISVSPFTSHTFLLPAELLVDFDDKVEALLVSVEYVDWSDSVRLLHVRLTDEIESIENTIAHYLSEMQSGSLNKARVMFRLPPLKPRPKKNEKKEAEPGATDNPDDAQ